MLLILLNIASTEETMLQYVQKIIVPFVEQIRDFLGEEKSAVIIMDNFKGQVQCVTPEMLKLLDSHHIHTCQFPPNTTDSLQPMDNKLGQNFPQTKVSNMVNRTNLCTAGRRSRCRECKH